MVQDGIHPAGHAAGIRGSVQVLRIVGRDQIALEFGASQGNGGDLVARSEVLQEQQENRLVLLTEGVSQKVLTHCREPGGVAAVNALAVEVFRGAKQDGRELLHGSISQEAAEAGERARVRVPAQVTVE